MYKIDPEKRNKNIYQVEIQANFLLHSNRHRTVSCRRRSKEKREKIYVFEARERMKKKKKTKNKRHEVGMVYNSIADV